MKTNFGIDMRPRLSTKFSAAESVVVFNFSVVAYQHSDRQSEETCAKRLRMARSSSAPGIWTHRAVVSIT